MKKLLILMLVISTNIFSKTCQRKADCDPGYSCSDGECLYRPAAA